MKRKKKQKNAALTRYDFRTVCLLGVIKHFKKGG